MLGQLTFDMFHFLGGHIIRPMRSVSYTRWSFGTSVCPCCPPAHPAHSCSVPFLPLPRCPWNSSLDGCSVSGSYTKAIYRVGSPSLFLCKCKTPLTSESYGFILSNLICLDNFYISFKRDYVSWNKNSPAHVH